MILHVVVVNGSVLQHMCCCVYTYLNSVLPPTQDIGACALVVVIYLLAGAAAGYFSFQWNEWVDLPDEFVRESSDIHDTFEHIRNALAATCVCIT